MKLSDKYLILIIFFFAILVIINAKNLKLFRISGDSMFPALQANDIILVKRKYWDFQKKDIIVFLNNIDSIIMIKRIYATYSDTIFINSNFKKTYFSSQSLNNSEIIKNKNIDDSLVLVDKNSFFVMGDNFQESMDSRHFGLVSQKNIFGKATIILFNYHNGKFRWDRFMKKIE